MLVKRSFLAILFCICTFGALNAAPSNLRLIPNFEISNSLSLASDFPSMSFRVVIPDDVFEASFTLLNSQADLDLYLYDSNGELVYYSEESDYNEWFSLSRLSSPGLASGEYQLEVLYQLSRPPVIDGMVSSSIDFSLRMDVIRMPQAISMDLDETYDRTLNSEGGHIDMFAIDLPEDAEHLRIDIFQTDADMDFALNPGESFTDPYSALFMGTSFMANEHGVFDVSRLNEDRFYLMVLPGVFEERDVNYSIRVSTDSQAPSFLFDIPELPQPSSSMSRNVLSTVEISTAYGGGSGCLITPDGYLLTNYHVIRNEQGSISDTIAIGMTLDERRPARELFLAEVVQFDADRDIALLKITSGFYGQPLPRNIRFPYFELADINQLRLGEDLFFLGYPSVGGFGSKPTITLTSGILSGFEDLGLGMTIKTDGEINFGNSGGAALTSSNKLVGLPTQLNPDSGGKIAYIHSIDMIPRQWLEDIGISQP